MKIGVSSYSFSKYMRETGANYFKIADLAKEMGFEGIEFTDLILDVQPAESQVALAKEIRAYCQYEVDHLWEEVKRFENPHKYYVDLSQKLYDTKMHLLDEKGKNIMHGKEV